MSWYLILGDDIISRHGNESAATKAAAKLPGSVIRPPMQHGGHRHGNEGSGKVSVRLPRLVAIRLEIEAERLGIKVSTLAARLIEGAV